MSLHDSHSSAKAPQSLTDTVGQRAPIVVIGAGAAGMLAAAMAAQRANVPSGGGHRVVVLEKNRKTGVKILMSGGTRCNITQNTNARGITSAFGHAQRFLSHCVGGFDPPSVIGMFHDLGVATKCESTGKIFPQSNSAVDVRDALHRQMIAAGAELRLGVAVQRVTRIENSPGEDAALWRVATENGGYIDARAVIVTAGGRSWPKSGTAGDAYAWLAALGHTIVPTRPALVPIVGGETWMHELSGLTLPDVIASVHTTPRTSASIRPRPDLGDAAAGRKLKLPRGMLGRRRSGWLWTHFGYSGPAAMDVSGLITAAAQPTDVELKLDIAPETSADAIDRHLQRRGGAVRISAAISDATASVIPSRLAMAICTADGADVRVAELTAARRRGLVARIKSLSLPVSGTRGFGKAEVTAGGVSLEEVDRRTMASRLHPGLYIAGEVLDVDGPIGGYNFQAAFATGRAAGIAAAMFVCEPSTCT